MKTVIVVMCLSSYNAYATLPSDIQHLVQNVRNIANDNPRSERAKILLRAASILRFQFPNDAELLALEVNRNLPTTDEYQRSQVYRLMLDVDSPEAQRIRHSIKDKNIVYNVDLDHCIEHRDLACGAMTVTNAMRADAYELRNLNWVIKRLANSDPRAARALFNQELAHFSYETATFLDVQILLASTQAILPCDLKLAVRGARTIKMATEAPDFNSRTEQVVSAHFMIKGELVKTINTRQTILVQVDSFLKTGSFPRELMMTFRAKHPQRIARPNIQLATQSNHLLGNLQDKIEQLNDFVLKDLSGQSYQLQRFRGKVVLLDFWATWCAPCLEEFPRLVDLAQHKILVFAITDENPDVVRQFCKSHPYSLKILLDTNAETFNRYEVDSRPTNILINAAGEIVGRWNNLPKDITLLMTPVLSANKPVMPITSTIRH